jgi:3-(3-hydroxy-phenyl)propionate hydroxylase
VTLASGERGWLLRRLGPEFTLLLAAGEAADALTQALAHDAALAGCVRVLRVVQPGAAQGEGDLADVEGALAQRYDLQAGSAVLIRPDQHVCARWRAPSLAAVRAAVDRALARSPA